jgi:uncharacterized protein (DUF983 family)
MKFFSWLFRKRITGQRVPKWCKAGKDGKRIICPTCGESTLVHHFAWTALTCLHCKEDHDKYDWFLASTDG